jgi:hypothetical protein
MPTRSADASAPMTALRAKLTMSDDGSKADLAPGCIEVRK